VPFDFALPGVSSVSKSSVEEIREWVLAASMDQRIDTSKGQYDANLRDSATGKMRAACIVTVIIFINVMPHVRNSCMVAQGYPIIPRSTVTCRHCSQQANRDDWNKLVSVTKRCPWCNEQESPVF
jgi:hypothetical protein